MAKKFRIAVVGATGLVGSELVESLARRDFPVESLRLFASLDNAGGRIAFRDDEIKIEPISADYARGCEIVFFAAHPLLSRDLAEEAVKAGAVVIDASRAFRSDPSVPLVVPELNPEDLPGILARRRIVASPSAAAVAVALVAAPLHRRWGIKRIVAVSAYGSSAAGRPGLDEHQRQTIGLFNQEEMEFEKFTRQSAFNLFPRVGDFADEETEVERDLETDLPRILKAPIKVAATAAQAPVFCGIGTALNLELGERVSPADARAELRLAPGVLVMDDPDRDEYPDTVAAMAEERVLAGRIRPDPSLARGLQLWISSDNLRKGSSLNMVQIAELLIGNWP
jgi:aspartate-semialdehyde dehydrogenase